MTAWENVEVAGGITAIICAACGGLWFLVERAFGFGKQQAVISGEMRACVKELGAITELLKELRASDHKQRNLLQVQGGQLAVHETRITEHERRIGGLEQKWEQGQ